MNSLMTLASSAVGPGVGAGYSHALLSIGDLWLAPCGRRIGFVEYLLSIS